MSVKIISDKTIMTTREARKKYRTYHIGFVSTEKNLQNPDNEKGYVVCIMDTYEEGFEIERKTEDGKFISVLSGYAVGGTEIGGVYLD